jgi:hypothetical protein
VCHAWGGKKYVQAFSGKPEWKRLLERLRSRWENGIKMHLRLAGGVE